MALTECTLRGEHVILEPLRPHHADELWSAASEPEIWTYMLHDVRSPQDFQAWVEKRLEAQRGGGALVFLQRDARTGQAFGSTSLFDYEALHRRVEIGHTWLARGHRRTAANSEAKLLLMTHAFETLGVRRVQFKCDVRNERSRQAILRLGAKFEGVLRAWTVLPDGLPRGTCIFSIVEQEWPSVKERLAIRIPSGLSTRD